MAIDSRGPHLTLELREEQINSRDKILAAASEMLRQEPGSSSQRLSVRNIAAQAGVSVGTLRHYFPTQRELLDTVLARVYEEAMPDDGIHDAERPARERLLECLQHLLAPLATPEQAREVWRNIFDTFIAADITPDIRRAYQVMDKQAQRRIEAWLSILTLEGSLPPGDNIARARFLLTVVDGLSIERALPTADTTAALGSTTLRLAVETLFL